MSKHLPTNCTPITTYSDLDSFAVEFARGAYVLIATIGDRGLGKSRAFSERLPADSYCLIRGASNTAFQVYRELYEHRDMPIVFDDADNFWTDPKARPMLNQFCETDLTGKPRVVTYRSREIERLELPPFFITSSRVAVICNSWPRGFASLADRGPMLHFRPSAEEVHRHVATAIWFDR